MVVVVVHRVVGTVPVWHSVLAQSHRGETLWQLLFHRPCPTPELLAVRRRRRRRAWLLLLFRSGPPVAAAGLDDEEYAYSLSLLPVVAVVLGTIGSGATWVVVVVVVALVRRP